MLTPRTNFAVTIIVMVALQVQGSPQSLSVMSRGECEHSLDRKALESELIQVCGNIIHTCERIHNKIYGELSSVSNFL